MTIFSPTQRLRIETAVRAAEARTSAEFLCAVARSADTYFTVPLIISAVVALALPTAIFRFDPGWTWLNLHDPRVTLLQFLCFAILALITTRPRIAVRLTPRALTSVTGRSRASATVSAMRASARE